MQRALQELQPQLVQTSVETEQLIRIIERDTAEVEVVKRNVEEEEAVTNEAAMQAKAIKVGLISQ